MKTRGLVDVERRLGPVSRIAARYALAGPAVVLEVGCGYGFAMRDLAHAVGGIRVMGLNLRRLDGQLEGLHYLYGDAGVRLPLADCSVDLIYAIYCLPFVHDRARFFEEAWRVLCDGGQLRVELPRDLGPEFGDLRNPDVIEGLPGIDNLRQYLDASANYFAPAGDGTSPDVLVLERRAAFAALRLKLKCNTERCIDCGVVATKYAGYVRSWYHYGGPNCRP